MSKWQSRWNQLASLLSDEYFFSVVAAPVNPFFRIQDTIEALVAKGVSPKVALAQVCTTAKSVCKATEELTRPSSSYNTWPSFPTTSAFAGVPSKSDYLRVAQQDSAFTALLDNAVRDALNQRATLMPAA